MHGRGSGSRDRRGRVGGTFRAANLAERAVAILILVTLVVLLGVTAAWLAVG